jgi:hypothetical protein
VDGELLERERAGNDGILLIPLLGRANIAGPGGKDFPMLALSRRAVLWAPLALMLLFQHGRAEAAPSIAVSPPDSIGPIELPGTGIVFPLVIHDLDSQGPGPLTWAIHDVDHVTGTDMAGVTESRASGTVAPADSAVTLIRLNGPVLGGGHYWAELRIESNDPLQPVIFIPMHFTIVAPVPVLGVTIGALKLRYQ